MTNKRLPLTREKVQARLDAIRAVQNDPERAHSEEDTLFMDVLEAIATHQYHGIEAAPLARLALESVKIDFERWMA